MGSFQLIPAGATGKIVYPSIVVQANGTTFAFNYPAREFPAFHLERYGKDKLSGAGLQQSMTQFIDTQFDFHVPFVPGSDVVSWFNFCVSALQQVPFDLYPDAASPKFITCLLMNKAADMKRQSPGRYELQTLKVRVLITQQAL